MGDSLDVAYNLLMKSAPFFVVVFLALLVCPPLAAADQDDPALNALFDRLYQTADNLEAQVIQAEIQRVWNTSGSATVDLLLERGTFSMKNGDYFAAERALNIVVNRQPNFAEGWNRRATLYYVMGRLEESVADVERTLALAPRHFGALSGLGQIYVVLGRFNEAREAFRRALAANPHLSGPRRFLRALDRQLGEPI